MMPRRVRRRGSAVPAGWLAADVVLVLVLVALANWPVRPASTPASAATPSAVPSSVAPVPPGMGPPVEFRVDVTPASLRSRSQAASARGDVLTKVRAELAGRGLTGKQAGFVEVFASGSKDEIDACVQSAEIVLEALRSEEPATFGRAAGDAYWGGRGDDLSFKIFFYN
ncbi:hypothetical protein [Dactylosporangium sp. CA-233914]|uniref:hypothetical protein n=1 Tax=Dactylosporangium sp. CA-233914 TaxID=3239934 RepID=UPI003D8AD44B